MKKAELKEKLWNQYICWPEISLSCKGENENRFQKEIKQYIGQLQQIYQDIFKIIHFTFDLGEKKFEEPKVELSHERIILDEEEYKALSQRANVFFTEMSKLSLEGSKKQLKCVGESPIAQWFMDNGSDDYSESDQYREKWEDAEKELKNCFDCKIKQEDIDQLKTDLNIYIDNLLDH